MKNIRPLIIIYLSLINISVFAEDRCVDKSYSDCYNKKMPDTFKENEWKWDTGSSVISYKFTSDGVEIFNDSNSIGTYSVEWINSYDYEKYTTGSSFYDLTKITENTISFVINMNGTYYLINSTYNYQYEFRTSTTSDIKEEMCIYYATNEEDAISNNFQEIANTTACTTYE